MRKAIKAKTGGYDIKQIIVTWLKKEGDMISAKEILASFETDKALVDLESPCAGKLLEIIPGNVPREPDDKNDEYLFEIPADLPTGNWDPILGYIEDGVADTDTAQASVPVAKNESPVQEPQNLEPVSVPHPKQEEPYIPPPVTAEKISPSLDFVKAGPMVRRLAKEKDVDLSLIPPTGPHGTVSEADLNKYLANIIPSPVQKPESPPADTKKTEKKEPSAAPSEEFEIVPLTPKRVVIGKHMTLSEECIPHAHTSVSLDMRKVLKATKVFADWNGLTDIVSSLDVRKDQKTKLSMPWEERTDVISVENKKIYLRPEIIVIEGIIRALELNKWKVLNSCVECEHFDFKGIKKFLDINLGIAYASHDGLEVPVLERMQGVGYKTIAERTAGLYQRMRTNKATLKERMGQNKTFTFNNVGALGADDGASIIPHGTSAICSLHRADLNLDGHSRGFANLNLAFDHRLFDGREAVGFLLAVLEFVEGVDIVSHIIHQFDKFP
ncbi:MAG: 2-oxo acid dehydrogenase subunit E2 [Candidatus Liptonbacteria bacterium]|nr:2-oxo acid dehydrogenase subunit E2 [Candidatus Liptonbacteria bacterium]